MKRRSRSSTRIKKQHDQQQKVSDQKRSSKQASDKHFLIKRRNSPRMSLNKLLDVIVPESESENSSVETSEELNISVPDTENEEDTFYEAKENLSDEEELVERQNDGSNPENVSGRRRNCPRKHKIVDYSDDESQSEVPVPSENGCEENESVVSDVISFSNKSSDEEEVSEKTPVYYLQTVLIPLEDIGDMLQSHSKGDLSKGWTFSIKRVSQSSVSENSVVSLDCDSNASNFNLSESSISDSEDSYSGSTYSWETSLESISSSNSWLPKIFISSSEEDSDTKSEELEEIDDDFVLHRNKEREPRKRNYSLRKIRSNIREKVAKLCNDSSDEESTDSSSEEQS